MREVASLTALTALQLVPLVWPEVRQQWLEWPLQDLTNLRRLALPTPVNVPECVGKETLVAVFGKLGRLQEVNCAGLRVTAAEAAAVGGSSEAGVWRRLIDLNSPIDHMRMAHAPGKGRHECPANDDELLVKRSIEVFLDNMC